MIIAIASKRGPKVEAVRQVLPRIHQFLSNAQTAPVYVEIEIDGGLAMPRTLDQLMAGAKHRVSRLQEVLEQQKQPADYVIGMEGGLQTVRHDYNDMVFLQSWAYVSNGSAGYFGSSGNVLLPTRIAREVMLNGRELGEVIDEFSRESDVRSKQGTWGVLTRDLLARQQSFEIALTAAFAPFYNRVAYE